MDDRRVISKGVLEKLGMKGSFLRYVREDGQVVMFEGEIIDHKIGIEYILGVLTSAKHGCLKKLEEIDAVGHRVVHGGEKFKASVFIDDEVVLGDRIILFPGVYIGKGAVLGDDALIYSNVSIRDKSRIGNRVTIHDGAVIGSDGFGFVTVEGVHQKIPQVGIAVIEDDVSIGANATIDRAALGETRIQQGTKMDDQVHVGHNVVIGKHGLFAAQTGISGSVKIGDYAVTGGQTGFSGHITVGNHVKMAGKSGITHDIEDKQTIAGFPAVPHLQWKRSVILVNKLSEMQKQIQQMEQKIQELEEKLKGHD